MNPNSQKLLRTKVLKKKIFFSFLFAEKTHLELLEKKEESEILSFAKNFLLSGFLLNSLRFDKKNQILLQELEEENQKFFLSYLYKKKELLEISKELNIKKINFLVMKGMALNIEKIYEPKLRQVRDIDLLVNKKDIRKTYEILKKRGFEYIYPETENRADYLYKHHLPPLINKSNVIVEIHWRVTSLEDYKICPLTDKFFISKIQSQFEKDIYIPSKECMISHAIYHGLIRDRNNLGPVFLFDLAVLFKSNNFKWPEDEALIKKLNIEKSFENCKKLIDLSLSERNLSNKMNILINELFIDENFKISEKKISIFGFSNRRILIHEIIKKSFLFFIFTSSKYQISLFSLKYWSLLSKEFTRVIKKIRP